MVRIQIFYDNICLNVRIRERDEVLDQGVRCVSDDDEPHLSASYSLKASKYDVRSHQWGVREYTCINQCMIRKLCHSVFQFIYKFISGRGCLLFAVLE